jgi:hypothetical protein
MEKGTNERTAEWSCQQGALLAKPFGCRVHVGRFLGDVAVEFTISIAEDDAVIAGHSECLAGLCDDGKGHFATIWGLGQVFVRAEQGSHRSARADTILLGKDYHLKLARSGASFQGFRDGVEIGQVTAPPLPGNRVFLYAIGGYSYRLRDLVIVGTLDPAWIASQTTTRILAAVDALFAESR